MPMKRPMRSPSWLAKLSPVQRALAKARKEKGLRKSQALTFESERAEQHDTVTQNVIIPDINYGGWSLIDEPYAPDYPGRKFDFI